MKGLFINNKKAKDSIYESGYMVYQCLLKSNLYNLDYKEIDINEREIQTGYNFYFFNYHPETMAWLKTKSLKKDLGFVITMILEVAPNDPFVMCPQGDFNFYCTLDPTLNSKYNNVYSFPRPLENINFDIPFVKNIIPVIGSFGFATKGKGFHHVVEAVNKEFDEAIVKINIPYGDFIPNSKEQAFYLGDLCKKIAKPGIDVQITHEFMSKESLIKWCASNTLNCFLYDRKMPGLSATTDQAIVTGKPLSVSDNDTFRHITAYLPSYPTFSLKESIEKSVPMVQKMIDDWQPLSFVKKFEEIIGNYKRQLNSNKKHSEIYLLPIKKNNLCDFLKHRIKKYKRKINNFNYFENLKIIDDNDII